MSTIPLTLIEGAMALPRLRPFDRLPAAFGREWALLPPNISFRVELKALYAAMLRTFCLSEDAIRSMCRWEPRRAASKAAGAPTRAQAQPASARVVPTVRPVERRMRPPVPASKSMRRRRLAGGACVVGGAAVLTWIALSHAPDRNAHDDARTDARLSSMTPSGDALLAGTARVADTRSQASPPSTKPAITGAHEDRCTAQQRQKNIAPDEPRARTKASRKSARYETHHASERMRSKDHHAALRSAPTTRRIAAPTAATQFAQHIAPQRSSTAMPSEDGRFSSRLATPASTDDYASIRIWASTHTGENSPSRDNARKAGADWMVHMTQRRVTEVPARFSK